MDLRHCAGLLPALLTLAWPARLPAANAPPPEADEEVVVTATPLSDVIQPALVLDASDQLFRRAPSIGETLDGQLGVNSSYFGPAASRPVIRGLGGSRVGVLSNSISALDVSDVSPDHAPMVEPLLADRIEVLRGPATLLYGSSAAGGVVNVVDARVPATLPDAPVGGAAELRGNTATGERAGVARLDGAAGQLAWHVDGFDRETSDVAIPGYAIADPAERPPGDPPGTLPNSYSEGDGWSLGGSWIAADGYLGLAYSGTAATYGLPGPEEELPAGEVALYPGPFLDMHQSRLDVRGEYRPAGPVEALRLQFGTNDYEHQEIEATGEVATTFKNYAWQGRLEAVHGPLSAWRGVLGTQLDYRDFSALGEEAFVPRTITRAVGVFVNEERDTGWGTLQLGARVEPLSQDVKADLPDYANTAISVAAGLAYELGASYRLTGNLSYTERNPATEELYSDGAHAATATYDIGLLVPPEGTASLERALNLDVGLVRRSGVLRWSAAVFYNDMADFIYQAVTNLELDGFAVAPYVQQDAYFYGFELELSAPLLSAGGWQAQGRLFSDYVRARLDDGGELPRIPPLRVGLGLEASRGPVDAGLEVTWYAAQDQISSFHTAAYTMINLNLAYDLDGKTVDWQFYVSGSNLADETARRSSSFIAAYAPLPGISLAAGLRASF